MCGLPFSGKTTLSKAISEYLNIPRVSFDEVFGEKVRNNSVVEWEKVTQICEDKIGDILKSGSSVIYDNLGDRFEHRERARNLAERNGAKVVVVYIKVSKDEVIKRRIDNLTTQDRHQVSNENFDNALNNFETPKNDEKVVVFDQDQDVESWIENNFK